MDYECEASVVCCAVRTHFKHEKEGCAGERAQWAKVLAMQASWMEFSLLIVCFY